MSTTTTTTNKDEPPPSVPQFYLPPPLNESIRTLTTGYNPWMNKYTGHNPDVGPDVPHIVLMTGGCLPLEENGSTFLRDAGRGFIQRCQELLDKNVYGRDQLACQCRPILSPTKFNPPYEHGTALYQGMAECVWEIRRLLQEHRQGLIRVGGISAKCSYEDQTLFTEAEELGIPLFLIGVNQPFPDEAFAVGPQPTGFVGSDLAYLGSTMARLLKQLRPSGGRYAFVTSWTSQSMGRRKHGFIQEIESDNHIEGRAHWHEIEEYPFNISQPGFVNCHWTTCMLERLGNPAYGVQADAIIMLFQNPLTDPNYTTWVDSYIRGTNTTLIAMDALDYLDYLKTGYVDGLVGQITWEMGTRSAEGLADIVARGLASPSNPDGVVLPPDRLLESRLVAYNVIPLDLDKVYPRQYDQNLLRGISKAGFVCFGIVQTSVLLCLLWTIKYRKNIVVVAAQPFFLLVILLGVTLLSSSMIPLSFDDDGGNENSDDNDDKEVLDPTFAVGICMSIPWLAFSGFCIIFSALFAKTWRVNQLFHGHHRTGSASNPSAFARVQVSIQDVMAPFGVMFTANLVVLLCWTLLDPLTYTRLPGVGTDFWNREIESYGTCQSESKALPFLLPLAFINFAVIAVACWQAFEARNLESEFAESRYIGMSVVALFQAFFSVLPVVAVVKEEPRAFYLVLVLALFLLSETILLLNFLPKMLLASKYANMSEREQRRYMSSKIQASSKISMGAVSGMADDTSSRCCQHQNHASSGVLETVSFEPTTSAPSPPENESSVNSTGEKRVSWKEVSANLDDSTIRESEEVDINKAKERKEQKEEHDNGDGEGEGEDDCKTSESSTSVPEQSP